MANLTVEKSTQVDRVYYMTVYISFYKILDLKKLRWLEMVAPMGMFL